MKETQQSCVEVKDSKEIVVREMLRFFYTGKIENLENICMDLYVLADRYMVDRLKSICTRALIQVEMRTENALEMYCIGRDKEMPLLVENAKRFLIA